MPIILISKWLMTERTAEYMPRPPTEHELNELSAWLHAQGPEAEDADAIARMAYVAVFDHYQTESPGYSGKAMSVIWAGSPTIYNVFTWYDGKMEEQVHDLIPDNDEAG